MKIQTLISAVIVNWNTKELLLQCIGALNGCSLAAYIEIVVVDNASSDGSAAAVSEAFPDVKLIPNTLNVGFGAATNQGMQVASGSFLLLINPDAFVGNDTLAHLLEFMSTHEEVGIVGPLIVDQEGRRQVSSFGLFPSPLEAFSHAAMIWKFAPNSSTGRRFLVDPAPGDDWIYTEHLLGACILLRREVIDRIGGFDERFFLFLEETDLCYRAQLAGWRVAYVTSAKVVHIGEQSMQTVLHRTGGHYIRSYNLFCRKHGVGYGGRIVVNSCLCAGIVIGCADGLLRKRSLSRSINSLRAFWYGYLGNPRPPVRI